MTTITEYVNNNNRLIRTQHINLSTDCIDAYSFRYSKPVKTPAGQLQRARDNLKNYLNLTGSTSYSVNTCHLCKSNTKLGGICVNPEHLYFGTAKENNHDKPRNITLKYVAKASTASAKSKNHVSKQKVSCPHCNKVGNPGPMKRWHFDNCKHKIN